MAHYYEETYGSMAAHAARVCGPRDAEGNPLTDWSSLAMQEWADIAKVELAKSSPVQSDNQSDIAAPHEIDWSAPAASEAVNQAIENATKLGTKTAQFDALRLIDFQAGLRAAKSKGRIQFTKGLSAKTPARMKDFLAGLETGRRLQKESAAANVAVPGVGE